MRLIWPGVNISSTAGIPVVDAKMTKNKSQIRVQNAHWIVSDIVGKNGTSSLKHEQVWVSIDHLNQAPKTTITYSWLRW